MAMLLISALLGITMRSWRYGLVCLITTLVPAIVGFGIWGLLDGQIGIALAVVTGMTLGIIVDDTVHFFSKYLHALRNKSTDTFTAVHYAFGNVGSALLITTLVLVSGFTVLAQSSFKTNAEMGLLTAITLVIALVIDFLLLPPLLMLIDRDKDRNTTNEAKLAINTSIDSSLTSEQATT
jgi:predicted RND superfamily exporter protein